MIVGLQRCFLPSPHLLQAIVMDFDDFSLLVFDYLYLQGSCIEIFQSKQDNMKIIRIEVRTASSPVLSQNSTPCLELLNMSILPSSLLLVVT